jgi:phenylalanyl-tRNA synthetase beta chain
MRLVVSWLRDFVDVRATPQEIADTLGLRGFEVASVEALDGGDAVIDFEITANRPDCLSVVGLAREVATAFNLPLAPSHATAGASVPSGESDRVRVTIEDEDLCPRYAAAVADVSDAAARVSTPDWMSARLQAAGVRPISPIVDVTNYVLIELGQPMHAFDLAQLAGQSIRVRRAVKGETVRTLDGVERKLEPDMLVIADRDRAQAVAGVMGGADSEVSPSTRAIVFESACFKPASVRRTSKRLGLKTEASSRFERGADIGAPVAGLQRAIALMEFIGAGRAAGAVVDRYPKVAQPARLHLRRPRLTALLGAAVPDADVERILRSLGLSVSSAADGWDVVPPTFRVDLLREADLIEEVGRHYGFDRLDAAFPPVVQPAPPSDPRITRDQTVRRVMTAAGLSEAVTFGFVEQKAAVPFQAAAAGTVAIANPLSAKFDTLRPSLLPGLVDAVAHNRRRGRRDVALFEIGTRFTDRGETRGVALAWTGAANEHWGDGVRDVDFFDVKGVVERLADALGVALTFTTAAPSYLVAGQAAAMSVDGAGGAALGVMGHLAPSIADSRGAPRHDAVFVAEIDLDAAWAARTAGDEAVRPLPRHPFVVRDVSIVVDDALPAEIIRGTILAAGASTPAPLTTVRVFDRYAGKGVPNGRVSVSMRMTFQSADRTLTDAEVQQSVEMIVAALVRQHHAVQR